MHKIKVIIADDEKLARDLIVNYLKDKGEYEIIAQYDNGLDTVKGIKELLPDIVFLDVQMPKLTGLEVVELLEFTPQIIFTTAYDQFAVKAFELNAIDYLLKPFSKTRFNDALAKARLQLENKETQQLKEKIQKLQNQTDRIAVQKGKNIVIIPFQDICYISASDDYMEIHTKESKYLKKITLDALQDKLPDNFIRIHRSTILNLNFLKQIEKIGKENYYAVTSNGIPLKVSRNFYPLLKEKINM
jgi:two-component system LytT family response regulator